MRSTRVAGHMCVSCGHCVHDCERTLAVWSRWTMRTNPTNDSSSGRGGRDEEGEGWQSVAFMCIDVLCTLTRTRPSHARGEVCTQYLSASVNFECSYMRSLARHQVGNPPIPAHDTYSMYICVSYAGARVRPAIRDVIQPCVCVCNIHVYIATA